MGCGCCGGTKAAWVTAVAVGAMAGAIAIAGAGKAPEASEPVKTPPAAETPKAPAAAKEATSVHDFTMKRIDGKEEALSAYKGKVLLIVNVASKCGYTGQYEGLQKLYAAKKDAGLVVLGFPANDFRNQEPGTNEEIMGFCSGTYGVTFPMFEKIDVAGADAHPLYKFLASRPEPAGGEPKWNFTKYLVGRDGKVVMRYDSKVKPDDAEMVKRIEELLAEKGDAAPAAPK